MTLTKQERQLLGKRAAFVGADEGTALLWRWLSSVSTFQPRSLADIYISSLRKLRRQTARVLTANGFPAAPADWIVTEYLCLEEGSGDETLVQRLQREVAISHSSARTCMDQILAFWKGLPCSRDDAWRQLGHYAWAEQFLGELVEKTDRYMLVPALEKPLPMHLLKAVSHLAYAQSGFTADPMAAPRLLDQMLVRKTRLVEALITHVNSGAEGPVFWNMSAFYAGAKSASDLAELQSYTELLALLKAFSAVECSITAADGKADAVHTNALCSLFWMIMSHLSPRDIQTLRIPFSSSVQITSLDLTDISGNMDYLQALFHLKLDHMLPDDIWTKPGLRHWRASLALPRLGLTRMQQILLVVSVLVLLPAALMSPSPLLVLGCLVILFVMYLIQRGGLDIGVSLVGRRLNRFAEKHPLLTFLLALLLLFLMWRLNPTVFRLPNMG